MLRLEWSIMAREPPEPETVGELLFWSYANLAMAHAAVTEGAKRYGRLHFMIRARLYKGLCCGSMNIGSILADERLKMTLPQCCAYCGATSNLSIDHLIPRFAGGPDSGDNAAWACRSCNSSKGKLDLLAWYSKHGTFPPLMLLRRYLKLAIRYASEAEILDLPIGAAPPLPIDLNSIPREFPAPAELVLWVQPEGAPVSG